MQALMPDSREMAPEWGLQPPFRKIDENSVA
jgi:hypothetical protein